MNVDQAYAGSAALAIGKAALFPSPRCWTAGQAIAQSVTILAQCPESMKPHEKLINSVVMV